MNVNTIRKKPEQTSNFFSSQEAIEKKKKHIIPSVYHFYRNPPLIVRGEGAYLFDTNGIMYLDCYSGVGAMSLGHSHPDLITAACDQLGKLQHTTTIYLTKPVLELAEVLAEVTPGDLEKSFFCASGTEANETAMLMASIYTGRENFLSIDKALHGRTKSAMSVTQIPMWKADPYLLESCDIAPGYESEDSLELIEKKLKTEKYAAIILEPIQGNGGILVPKEGYWKKIREICSQTETLLIADEVQTGINRTGSFYAVEHEEVVPDFLTTAKALGNGLPIAACITKSEIADSIKSPLASTYGGNPIACQVALAVIQCHQNLELGQQALDKGQFLKDNLEELSREFEMISEVRGRGLMIGLEIDSTIESVSNITDMILEKMKDEGYLIGKTGVGRNVLTFMPPLIIEKCQLKIMCESLREVLHQIKNECE